MIKQAKNSLTWYEKPTLHFIFTQLMNSLAVMPLEMQPSAICIELVTTSYPCFIMHAR